MVVNCLKLGVYFHFHLFYGAYLYSPHQTYFFQKKVKKVVTIFKEFTLQDNTEIGYPTFDVFFNARIRRTRLFLKVENVTSNFSTKNFYSAPDYPFRDSVVRFGLVWNWFI